MAQGLSYIGCAGWSLPRAIQHAFPAEGSHLQRYAGRLNGAEINSSFHRPHTRAACERWAAAVPADFRFSVKLPKTKQDVRHHGRRARELVQLDHRGATASRGPSGGRFIRDGGGNGPACAL